MMNVSSPAEIDRLIAQAAVAGHGYKAEIWRPVRNGALSFYQVARDSTPPLRRIRKQTRPTIVLLGDDDYASSGPSGWRYLPALLKWAAVGMIHGAGGDVPTYRAAAGLAALHGRLLMIETDSAHLMEWTRAFGPVPFMAVTPKDGPHPIQPSKGGMH
jgi:hypothetical protein